MLSRFYLGITDPSWIGRSPAPLMVSAEKPKRYWGIRAALNGWALDSGGYTHVLRHGGWTRSADEHAELARYLQDRCAGLEWAAPQDWMCEPHVLAKTGLTIEEHQKRTVANFLELRSIAPDVPWIPVLQGYATKDYYKCWEMYRDEGVDLLSEPLVGVGSVCRRQASDDIELVFYSLFLDDLRLHGFGVSLRGLYRSKDYLQTADSHAWSATARYRPGPLCGSTTHKRCTSCYAYSHEWYQTVAARCNLPPL